MRHWGIALTGAIALIAAMPMTMHVRSAADAGYDAAMSRMNGAMQGAPMTGNADRDFLVMMVPHHQGAIDMCKTELRYGRNARVLALCHDIVSSQSAQIRQMQQILSQH